MLGWSADDRGSERSRELTLRRKDATTGVFLDTSRAVWDGAGKIIRYQGTLVDVTERRKMEKALRQQEEFQRYLLESFPDLILVVGLDGRYTLSVRAFAIYLGRAPAEMLGQKVDDAEQEQSAEFVALYHDVSTGTEVRLLRVWGAPSRRQLAHHARLTPALCSTPRARPAA